MSTEDKNTTPPDVPRWTLHRHSLPNGGVHFVVTEQGSGRTILSVLGGEEDREAMASIVAARNLVRNSTMPREIDLGGLLNVETAMLDDAAELIALSAAATCEGTRLHWENMFRIQEGWPISPIINSYALILHDMLAGREVVPSAHTEDGSHG